MWMIRQFNLLVETLKAELRLIRESIEEQVSSIRATYEADRETRDQIPSRLAELRVPENEKHENRKYRERSYAVQLVTAIGTCGAFLAASIYAAIAAYQAHLTNITYGEIQKQTAAAQCTAKAAQEQSALMRKQVVGTQAAVIYLTGPGGIDANGNGKIAFINRGSVYGSVTGDIEVTRLESHENYTLVKKKFNDLFVAPYIRSDIPPVVITYSIMGMEHGFTPTEVKTLTEDTPKMILRMQVNWSFDDGFGDFRSYKDCYSLFTAKTPWTGQDGAQHSQGGGFIPCDQWDGWRRAYMNSSLRQ